MEVARMRWVAAALLVVAGAPSRAAMEETRLLEFRTGSALSQSVRAYQSRGYELSDGTPIVFGDWYRSNWPDTHMSFLTPLSSNVGLIWGFGTGEKGGQYEIQPSVKIGFIAIRDIGENETLTFSVRGVIGGHLGERPCRAGYGAIGGSYLVNCRLAATTMRPADTLDHLFDSSPVDRFSVSLRYRLDF